MEVHILQVCIKLKYLFQNYQLSALTKKYTHNIFYSINHIVQSQHSSIKLCSTGDVQDVKLESQGPDRDRLQ